MTDRIPSAPWPWTVPDLARIVTEQVTEIAQLRAILEGSTTAPTDEELDAHAKAGGVWMMSGPTLDVGPAVTTPGDAWGVREARDCAAKHLAPGTIRWRPIDKHARPCAWPVVGAAK